LGFKFWTVVDFYGDFRLRGLVRGAAAVVSWLGGRLSHYGSFFFGRGEVSVCVYCRATVTGGWLQWWSTVVRGGEAAL